MQIIFTVCYLCCATGLGVGEFSVHLFCPACEAESRISCMFQIPESFSPLSSVCFRFWRLSPLSSVCFRFWRLFHRCLLDLYISDSRDFFTTVCCMFWILETCFFYQCLLYVSDSRGFSLTTVFCMFQILESSQTLLNVLKRESQSLKEKSYPTTTGGSTQRTMTQS